MEKEIDLTVSCYGKMKGVKYDVVILPWGATEPPPICICLYLTDCILPHDIAVDAAALALEFRVRCMVMPPVPFGTQSGAARTSVLHSCALLTQRAILEDIVASLYAQRYAQADYSQRSWQQQLQGNDS